jgi:hypothetical protein
MYIFLLYFNVERISVMDAIFLLHLLGAAVQVWNFCPACPLFTLSHLTISKKARECHM